ncbi:hypothetical protein CAter282_1617 [Collimonas arenae]|uniref:Uncharacterized protein n=1 Tax=Collimonas arenae TaxID=279058 RepID=A0A127PNW3_9BURK|nr:hypothetical protein CAter10_1745 [Collimonas arenae]AMP09399.1 hypothetical protein CAter282_1617 [Collimonas arenae]
MFETDASRCWSTWSLGVMKLTLGHNVIIDMANGSGDRFGSLLAFRD